MGFLFLVRGWGSEWFFLRFRASGGEYILEGRWNFKAQSDF